MKGLTVYWRQHRGQLQGFNDNNLRHLAKLAAVTDMKHCLKSHPHSNKGVADPHPFFRFYGIGKKKTKHSDPVNTPALYDLRAILM